MIQNVGMIGNRKQTIRFDDEIDQVNSDHIELGSSSAVTNNNSNQVNYNQPFNQDLKTKKQNANSNHQNR